MRMYFYLFPLLVFVTIVACALMIKQAVCACPLADERPECFERQDPAGRFFLARMNPQGGYGWAGHWDSLTVTLKAADLLHCRMISDPTNGQ